VVADSPECLVARGRNAADIASALECTHDDRRELLVVIDHENVACRVRAVV
jgi:hypothetical protein